MKNVLFYGDSNTWGYVPGTGERYAPDVRWTGVAAAQLGAAYTCLEAGLNGRTTVYDDPCRGCRNGLAGLDQELLSHKPLDLLVLLLGTNDLCYGGALQSANGIRAVLLQAKSANARCFSKTPPFVGEPRILLISPPTAGPFPDGSEDAELMPRAQAESARFAALYRAVAEEQDVDFLDAAPLARPGCDGLHLTEAGHAALGRAVAERIQRIFSGGSAAR